MRIALLQLNPTICDLKGNAEKIVLAARTAFNKGADICVTPELAIIGYPPRDLLLQPEIIDHCLDAARWVGHRTANLGPVLLGTPFWSIQGEKDLYNGACLLMEGQISRFFGKVLLPEYDVFDEERYFSAHDKPGYFDFLGRRIGVTICEDIWNNSGFGQNKRYSADPVQILSGLGVDIIINLSASPFSLGKQKTRLAMIGCLSRKYGITFVFCNQVGGNDELIFAGRSIVLDHQGTVLSAGREFEEDVVVADIDNPDNNHVHPHDYCPESETWKALVLGIRDYARKNGFTRALLGLSGGIDSALVAALAAHALKPENVTGILMPSRYSSPGSIDDSMELAANLGIKTMTIPITKMMQAYESALAPIFFGIAEDVTEENIQARIRGNLLMAVSNKLGGLVLATGNKSELAVGYTTLYGDMCGGLAPLSDTPKTLVYNVARWLNRKENNLIPGQIIAKAPSAELRPDQKDQDSLPDYETLDQILQMHIEDLAPAGEIIAQGFSPDTVLSVASMVKKAEFKRRQSPPGLKTTSLAFGTGRRMPLAARCTDVTKMLR